MSTAADFPGNCVTNTFILHEYSEIACIVCTHATPADRTSDSGGPEKVLDRLRNAEKQFRQHSFLVALDSNKLELYTFHRKIDILKDQRTVFGKITHICKLNSCTVSARQPVKIKDLLKPELSRIHDLLTSAILSSVQILPKNGERVIPIGSRIYLVPETCNPQSQSGEIEIFRTDWHIHRLNVQLLPTGHIILIVQNASSGTLSLVSEMTSGHRLRRPPIGSVLYLAPTGQIARYSDGMISTPGELSETMRIGGDNVPPQIRFAHTRITTVSTWLKQKYNSLAMKLTDDVQWVEIEVAVFDVGHTSPNKDFPEVSWRQLMWPSTLTFVFKSAADLGKITEPKTTDTDPLKFALDWFNNSAERNGALSRAQALKDVRDDEDEDQLFNDEAHFEDHFHPHTSGPPTFSVNQMVYPTPPDAAIAHPTPGLSSVDGVAPTPAPALGTNQPDAESFLDQEMPDVVEMQPSRVGTGFYNEDLFEEMPDDKFGPSADVNESDWDFFDARGSEDGDNMATKGHSVDEVPELRDLDLETDLDGDKVVTAQESSPKQSEFINEGVDADQAAEFPKPSPMETDSIYTNDLTVSPTTVQQYGYVGKSISGLAKSDQFPVQSPADSFLPPTVSPQTTRRRSSIFEGIQMHSKPSDHDSRYDKHGKYWFDDERRSAIPPDTALGSIRPVRPVSSSSGTSMTSGPSESDTSSSIDERKLPLLKRTWTEYHPDSPAKQEDQVRDVDLERCRAETEGLLEVVSAALGEEPFSHNLNNLAKATSYSSSSNQKKLMIAQLLVDQVSQSFLLRQQSGVQFHKKKHQQMVDVVIDHTGNKTPVGHATMAELATNPSRTASKITKLDSRLLCANRSGVEITARQSILPFWDNLGLRPYHRAKDITTFCLHSNADGVAESCLSFTNRLADTYATCNLGSHLSGRVTGLTNDGLIAWSSGSQSGPSLRQLCQQLGAAISGSSTSAMATFVVYVVSPDEDVSGYREICDAFTILFEAFLETSEKTKKKSELVLQILPLSFIAASDTIVVPSQDAYLQLAFEVYNRVPVSQLYDVPGACASAVVLDKHQAREPVFELSNSATPPFSKDGPCLHLAYSYSPDGRWLTAAWTDEQGLKALTMSYCLRVARGGPNRPKREVFRSLWDTCHDIMGRVRDKWRLVVAHTRFKLEDLAEWQHLMSPEAEERRSTAAIILIDVDLDPEITAEVRNMSFRLSQQPATMQPPAHSGTPVSTPQAQGTSPDQVVAATPTSGSMPHGNAATPPDHNVDSMHDAEASLVDPAEQSWAILLFFGLQQASSYHKPRAAAAASGLLIKRTGCRDEGRALQMLGVNLVAALRSPANPMTVVERESVLQEIIEQYRGLVTLAASRGCIDKSLDCVPWHVATAMIGARALGEAM